MSQTCGFCSGLQNDGRHGTSEEALQRCISRGRHNTGDMSVRHVRRSGRKFAERGCILEHQCFKFAKMILHDRCSTSYDLGSHCFVPGAILFRHMGWKDRKTYWHEAISSALDFPFLKEVSQNCFFLMFNFEN